MDERARVTRFESEVLIHLDAAYALARWIARDPTMAWDAVQEGCLHALRNFDRMHGLNARAWFLAIIRNASIDQLRRRRGRAMEEPYEDEAHGGDAPGAGTNPEEIAVRASDARWLRECIDALPQAYREVIVLRELEELSYKEISAIVDVPVGTVMSRLARARDLLQQRMRFAQKRTAS